MGSTVTQWHLVYTVCSPKKYGVSQKYQKLKKNIKEKDLMVKNYDFLLDTVFKSDLRWKIVFSHLKECWNGDFLSFCVPFLCSVPVFRSFLVPSLWYVPFIRVYRSLCFGVWSVYPFVSSGISGDNWTNLTNPRNVHILRYYRLSVSTGVNCPHDMTPSLETYVHSALLLTMSPWHVPFSRDVCPQ